MALANMGFKKTKVGLKFSFGGGEQNVKEEEKRRGRGRRWRSQDQANKVWNLDFCMELTLDMNYSMDHTDFVWLMTCLQI